MGATQHFAIGPNGEINDVMELTLMTPGDAAILGAQRARVHAELVDRLEQVVRTANDVEGDLIGSLQSATRQSINVDLNASVEAAAAFGDTLGGSTVLAPPKGGAVGDNAGYWASLTAAQQKQVLDKHPEWVGNLDGVPASVRDQANRSLLASERTRLQGVASKLQAELDSNIFGGTFSNADAGLEQTREKLKALTRSRRPWRNRTDTCCCWTSATRFRRPRSLSEMWIPPSTYPSTRTGSTTL